MKNKIITLLLSFTFIFTTTINSMAFNPATLPAPVIATVGTLAVASGITISSDDDIYKVSRIFYEKYKDNQEIINQTFDLGVSILENKVVSVSKDFLNLVKGAFDDVFTGLTGDVYFGSIPSILNFSMPYSELANTTYIHQFNDRLKVHIRMIGETIGLDVFVRKTSSTTTWTNVFGHLADLDTSTTGYSHYTGNIKMKLDERGRFRFYLGDIGFDKANSIYMTFAKLHEYYNSYSIPFDDNLVINQQGVYNPGYLEQDNLGIYVPGNVSDLIGKAPSDVLVNGEYVPGYDLPVGGVVTLPGVSNPSIDSVDGVFNPPKVEDVPGVGNPSIPSDSVFASIKEFIISLVVPSDSFWTDTFNGFRDNFSKNFPMLDMSKFDSLAVGGKPFPNLYAYGSKIVDGDVINSIVDWLRPIVAGFIMICLMFFNYRKIYKLIRNTEPFGGIAQGSSDFRTGLSAPPINNGLDSNPMGNLRDTLFDMRNEILRRENEK